MCGWLTELIYLQLQVTIVWPTSSWNRQVGSWGLGNSRQRVNYPFFQKLRAYCGSWRIWRWSDSLPKGGSTLSYRTRSPGIHPASPNSFLRDWPICWCYVVGCRGGSTRKFTYWAEWRWHWSWLRIMIAKETSAKTEQWVVSPGHKPNNEQLQFICFYILLCFVLIIVHIKLFPQRDEHLFFSVPGVRDH